MPPAAFLHPQNAPKSLAAGGFTPDPLGELTALPRPTSWIQGAYGKRREAENEGRGRLTPD